MQTSGLVLDVYDDYNGALLRASYPTLEEVPPTVKQAHAITVSERDKLPDDAFALVLVQGTDKFRKYACIDGGNTTLSVLYFLENGYKLPVEAQKVAAANLVEACGWFEVPVPDNLEKVALGLGSLFGGVERMALAVPIAKSTHQEVKGNLRAVNAFGQGGNNILSPQQMGQAAKFAEVTATSDMPLSAPTTPGKPKTVVKTSSPRLVDVTNLSAPHRVTEKVAERYALPALGRYPLDSYAQVKRASAYFDEYGSHFTPEDRREYCSNMTKRANELDIPVSDRARKYGSDDFAPDDEIKIAFDARRLALGDQKEEIALLDQIEKRARKKVWLDEAPMGKWAGAGLPQVEEHAPWAIAEALSEFDKIAGLTWCYDRTIPDAYYSIYGSKTAALNGASVSEWSEIIGNDMVTASQLQKFATRGAVTLRTCFNDDFQKKFQKDPVSTFKGLPIPQRKMIMRMANEDAPGGQAVY